MNRQFKLISIVVMLALLLLADGASLFNGGPQPAAASSPPTEQSWAEGERPFGLPFADPSGPDTWLLAQPYGNTTGAYYRRYTLYGASGGIHFGVDLSAPCGTDIVAIADGVVFAVDGPFGSPPHNLTIDHPQLGYASMYGHLIEAPDLRPGQTVEQGQVIAKVGDSAGICYRRPHLHLEIRDLDHARKYNPSTLVDANWDSLTLIGSGGRPFMRDLDEPRKWQALYDQPQVWTAGPIVNDFEATWPFDWEQSESSSVRSPGSAAIGSGVTVSPDAPQLGSTTTPALQTSPVGRQLTAGDCCTLPYWSPDSSQLRFVDRPRLSAELGIWGVETDPSSQPSPKLISDRLGIYSPDGNLIAYPDRASGLAVVERLADGQTWEIDTGQRRINFTPDSQSIMWMSNEGGDTTSWDGDSLWLADVDGSNQRLLLSARSINPINWLADDQLLLVQQAAGTSDVRLLKLSLKSGAVTELMTGPRMRGVALSPDRRHLVYYARLEADSAKNGVWLLDLQDPNPSPSKAPFFGSYRWRDDNRLVYVPYDPEAVTQDFYEFDIVSRRTRPLFPDGTGLTIANSDWQVSPDGSQIGLVAARGKALDGIWVLDIE